MSAESGGQFAEGDAVNHRPVKGGYESSGRTIDDLAPPPPGPALGIPKSPGGEWWVINGAELLAALYRVAGGDNPDVAYAEMYANSDSEDAHE